MGTRKSDQFNMKDLWTIPNIITYFRILCIPVFVVLSVYAGRLNSMTFVYWALAVFAIAAASDLFDGMLARKYNWGTGVGMLLDPFADKLMHISVVICLAVAIKIDGEYFLHWGFIIAIAFKELMMICFAPIIAKKGVEVKANMIGKIASATLSGGVIVCFFHPFVKPWDWAIILTAVVQSYFAAANYLVDILRALKKLKIEDKEKTEVKAVEIKVESLELPEVKKAKADEVSKADKSDGEAKPTANPKNETKKVIAKTATAKTETAKPASTAKTATTKPANTVKAVTAKPKTQAVK